MNYLELLFLSIRIVVTVDSTAEAFVRTKDLLRDPLASVVIAIAVAMSGLIPLLQEQVFWPTKLRERVARSIQILIILALDALTAMFLSQNLQAGLRDLFGGYSPPKLLSFLLVLLTLWLVDVYLFNLPGVRGRRRSSGPQKRHHCRRILGRMRPKQTSPSTEQEHRRGHPRK